MRLITLIIILFLFVNLKSQESVLSVGHIVKVRIDSSGVYKLPYDTLLNWGFANPDEISIYGINGKQLDVPTERKIDTALQNIALYKNTGYDTIFNNGDYYLFYAEGVITNNRQFTMVKHKYSQYNYYYITDSRKKKLMKNQPINKIGKKDTISTHHSIFAYFNWNAYSEDDNCYGTAIHTDALLIIKTGYNYYTNSTFSHGFIGISNPNRINGFVECKINDNDTTVKLDSVNRTIINLKSLIKENPKEISISLLSEVKNSVILSDVQLILTEENIYKDKQVKMYYTFYQSFPDSCYVKIQSDNESLKLWNIDDIYNPVNIKLTKKDSQYVFPYVNLLNKRFVCFDDNSCEVPSFDKVVENQNLRNAQAVNYLVIANPNFEKQATRLANFRNKENGYSVLVVNTEKIYNEFSSGKTDPVAIRDFIKTIYDKGISTKDSLIYVVLLGDGIIDCMLENNTELNYIPVYRSNIQGDNLFGVMKNIEYYRHNQKMDLAVGRLPVRTSDEAEILVDKTIHRSSDISFWRNNITLVSGKVDYNNELTFFKTVDLYAENIFHQNLSYNINKLYFDELYDANIAEDSILRLLKEGQSILGYFGHSNDKKWDDNVLTIDAVKELNNTKLPIVISHSCSYAKFDKKERCIAEEWLLNKNGGAIALYGGTRLISSGIKENSISRNSFFKIINKQNTTIGMSLVGNDCNDYNILLGDPAIKFVNSAIIDSINYEESSKTFTGFVSKSPTSSSGKLYLTFYDTVLTKVISDVNNNSSIITHRNREIFTDSTDVVNGKFEYTINNFANLTGKDSLRVSFFFKSNSGTEIAAGYYYLPTIDIEIKKGYYTSVYPTITSDNIEVVSQHYPITKISIYNQFGVLINTTSYTNEFNITIDLSIYSSGMYFISVFIQKGQPETHKVILQKGTF